MGSRFIIVFSAVVAVVCASAGTALAGKIPGQYIVVLKSGESPATVAAEHARSAGAEILHQYRHALAGYSARLTATGLAKVRSDDRVLFVSADREVHALAQQAPTGLSRIEGSSNGASQTLANDGAVGVAVIDTGIDLDHPDLAPVTNGKNCVRSARSADDDNGHGSHVAGTIAARENSVGGVGVAPAATLYAVKVLDRQGSGSWSAVVCGIDWVTANASRIKVANMSLGGTGSDDANCGNTNNDALHRAICRSVAAGVTYVVAAGNSGVDVKGAVPAGYDEVLTVTAVADFNGARGGGAAATCRSDVDETYADFSNYATLAADQAHTIAAPGVCIYSAWKNGGYDTISGTSMASPHVTGVAALCLASNSCAGLAPAQVVQKLRADAERKNAGDTGYGFTGDPLRPVSGKHFGYLTWAAAY